MHCIKSTDFCLNISSKCVILDTNAEYEINIWPIILQDSFQNIFYTTFANYLPYRNTCYFVYHKLRALKRNVFTFYLNFLWKQRNIFLHLDSLFWISSNLNWYQLHLWVGSFISFHRSVILEFWNLLPPLTSWQRFVVGLFWLRAINVW